MTAIILAGGKSSRMGFDKALLKINNHFLMEEILQKLKTIFAEILIVTNRPKQFNSLTSLHLTKIACDIIPHQGPLGGIYSGLMNSGSFYNFVLACDMPFVNLELIKYMVSIKDNFDAVVPKLKKGYEALFAIYSKNCISAISEILKTGDLKVVNFFNKLKLRELNEKEISRFGAPDVLFMNINTREDLSRAGGGKICQN